MLGFFATHLASVLGVKCLLENKLAPSVGC